MAPRYNPRRQNQNRVGCAFCWEYIPPPKHQILSFSGEGSLGGVCPCGAAFVIDETGKAGGQALLDALALACGDLDKPLELSADTDYQVKTKDYVGTTNSLGRMRGHSYMRPKVWFIKLNEK